ncbi:MAG: PASTA domain-containing protein [Solirubrobacteraceae bacterium]
MTGRIKSLLLMLFAVVAAIALGAPAVASASPPLPKELGFTPNIVVPGPDDPPRPPPGPVKRSSVVVTVAFKGGYSTPASFPDQTEAAINDQIQNGLNPFLTRVSRGRFLGYSRGTTHQYVVVQPQAQLCSDAWVNEVTDQAKAAERRMGTDPDNYDAVVYYFKKIPDCGVPPWGGKADFPENGNRVILNGDMSLGILAHEFGHHLGLGHAGAQFCVDNFHNPVPLYGPLEARCTQTEYGDAYSAMGDDERGGEYPRGYSASELNQLGWNVGTETISAGDPTVTKVLTRLEDNVPGSTQALRLIDGVRTLWVEFRANPFSLTQGALLVMVEEPSLAIPPAKHVAPFLLDMTPLDGDVARAPGSRTSQELPVGQAWTNPLGNMTITLNSADTHNASVTIQSTPGPVPGPPPGPGPGPGPTTVAVPDVTSETIPSATSEITRAGLVRGVVRTTINCEDIDRVVSQSPVAGVQLPPGGTVDLTQGIPPPGGCGTPQ